MEVIAHARMIRMSPRKIRLVADLIRGVRAADADAKLRFVPKAAATPVRKLLASAVANAEHNFRLAKDGLIVKSITVNQGPVIKRFRPRAMGRAAPIRKRMSHITIVLTEKNSKSEILKPKQITKSKPV